jgi:hypothetical protein
VCDWEDDNDADGDDSTLTLRRLNENLVFAVECVCTCGVVS